MRTMVTPETLPRGLCQGLDMAAYLALPCMSASKLETLRRSPLQYRHALTKPAVTSDALERGTALHLAILEPALFETRYIVAEPCEALLQSGKRKGEPCGKAGLFLHKDVGWVCGIHVKGFGSGLDTDAEVISAENAAAVRGMAAAVAAHPRAKTLFDGRGEFEATIVFDDPETGVTCRIRPDRLVERVGMNVDIKSTRDAAEWAFPRDAENRGYFRKLAFYRRGLRSIGWPYQSTAVLAIESAAPHDLIPYLVLEEDLDSADQEITRLLERYKMCEADGVWEGYATEFLVLRRPAWAVNKED